MATYGQNGVRPASLKVQQKFLAVGSYMKKSTSPSNRCGGTKSLWIMLQPWQGKPGRGIRVCPIDVVRNAK